MESQLRSHSPQSPRFQSACGGGFAAGEKPDFRDRSPRDFRVLVAGERHPRRSPVRHTAVPAISECLWRSNAPPSTLSPADRSPRDFRVLVAARERALAVCKELTAVPAISECLWRSTVALVLKIWLFTAVPAISECLWRS